MSMEDQDDKKKVFVAMSGGVDSSVTAAMLKEKKYQVTGVFMRCFLQKYDLGDECIEKKDLEDARKVAKYLKIPFKVYDFRQDYEKGVIKYFEKAYQKGITPNPDVMCNKVIKFDLFLRRALKEGADFIATGHYVKKIASKNDQLFELYEGIDPGKDQSYFLWTLTQEQIKPSLFPIGAYDKTRIRKLAERYKLHVHDKRDSQGICFLGKIDIGEYLRQFIPTKTGAIVDTDGKKVGEHDGIYFYTIGQRKGIGIGATGPYYVLDKDLKKNILYVTGDPNSRALFSSQLNANSVHWISGSYQPTGSKNYLACHARIRYHHSAERCRVYKTSQKGSFKVVFRRGQRAVTPGQSIVFYKKRRDQKTMQMLGGGIIQ